METARPGPFGRMKAPDPTASGFLRARRILTLDPSVSGDSIWWRDGRIRGGGTGLARSRRWSPRHPDSSSFPTRSSPRASWTGTPTSRMWALGRRRVQLAGAESREEALRRVAAARTGAGMGRWARAGTRTAGIERPIDWRSMRCSAGPVYLDSPRRARRLGQQRGAGRAPESARDTPDPFGGRIVRDAAGRAHRAPARARRRADDARICPSRPPSCWTRRCARPRPRRIGWA